MTRLLSWEMRNKFLLWAIPKVWGFTHNYGGRCLYVPQGVQPPFLSKMNKLPPKNSNKRFVCISDLHGQQGLMKIPEGDVLVICGDLLDNYTSIHEQKEQLRLLNVWLKSLPHRDKIVIAGNHDKICADLRRDKVRQILKDCTYLEDESTTIQGFRVFGSPTSITGLSDNRAFQYERGSANLKNVWENIPEVDILITHSPPAGFLDGKEGCEFLKEVVFNKKPLYHIFGHMHCSYGVIRHRIDDNHTITFVNASSLNDGYYPIQHPIVFDIANKDDVAMEQPSITTPT